MRLLAIILLLPVSVAMSADYYCDPIKGDTKAGDGSASKPWGTLESVCAAKLIHTSDATKGKIHAGDTIKLRSGNHGKPNMQGIEYTATAMTTIEADEGHKPVISQFVSGSGLRNWTFRGIGFHSPDVELAKYYTVFRAIDVADIVVENCEIRPAGDVFNWTDKEWETRCPFYGLHIKGTNFKVVGNHVLGMENGVFVDGDKIEVADNHIEYFCNDGFEHTASNLRVVRNRITDLYDLKSNEFHHDGMQGWNFKDVPMTDIVIEDNFVAHSTGKYPNIPPISEAVFQGIVAFDGAFERVAIRNNIVMITAYHGIAMYGVKDGLIENNTLVYQGPASRGPCWICVSPRRASEGSAPPENIRVVNNIAPTYNLTAQGVSAENNFAFKQPNRPWDKIPVVDPSKTFRVYDPANAKFDLTLVNGSPAQGPPQAGYPVKPEPDPDPDPEPEPVQPVPIAYDCGGGVSIRRCESPSYWYIRRDLTEVGELSQLGFVAEYWTEVGWQTSKPSQYATLDEAMAVVRKIAK